MEKEMIASLILSSFSLFIAAIALYYIHQLNRKFKDLESRRHASALLNARMEDLKKITRSLNRIDKVIISSRLERQKNKPEIIDKSSQAYFSTKDVFDEHVLLLPGPVAENLLKEKDAIDSLITYVKERLTKESVEKTTVDNTLLELLQRETVWVDTVEKNFKQQLEDCVNKMNAIMN